MDRFIDATESCLVNFMLVYGNQNEMQRIAEFTESDCQIRSFTENKKIKILKVYSSVHAFAFSIILFDRRHNKLNKN